MAEAGEVLTELRQGLLNYGPVGLGVVGKTVGDVIDTTGPSPDDVDQVVGVLRFAAVGEGKRLEQSRMTNVLVSGWVPQQCIRPSPRLRCYDRQVN